MILWTAMVMAKLKLLYSKNINSDLPIQSIGRCASYPTTPYDDILIILPHYSPGG